MELIHDVGSGCGITRHELRVDWCGEVGTCSREY